MPSPLPVGIHDLSIATTHYLLEHATLADHYGVNAAKYHVGLGQEAMSIPAPDEDIVTMAATAAEPILERHGTQRLRTVLLATESGVDQAKSAGLYLHPLIGLPHTARVVELKQACYGGTAALHLAAALVAREPAEQVLVIATDIAEYDPGTPAEATQGAAAVALLVSADPAVLQLDSYSGIYSDHVMDFWRPNYRTTPMVDGKASVHAYLTAAVGAYADYYSQTGRGLSEFHTFCYHQPFTKMAYKAHRHLLETHGLPATLDDVDTQLRPTAVYNRIIGNSYTASLYLALASLLDSAADLTHERIALLSYGSGHIAEFFSATTVPGYRQHLRSAAAVEAVAHRKPLTYHEYRAMRRSQDEEQAHTPIPVETSAPYRFAGLIDHKRIYERNHYGRDSKKPKEATR